jgi:hypothetical protein
MNDETRRSRRTGERECDERRQSEGKTKLSEAERHEEER